MNQESSSTNVPQPVPVAEVPPVRPRFSSYTLADIERLRQRLCPPPTSLKEKYRLEAAARIISGNHCAKSERAWLAKQADLKAAARASL